jgi:hypothetical protein
MPILSWGSERIIPVLDVECGRPTICQWIIEHKPLAAVVLNLLECFKPEEQSRRPSPVLAMAIIKLACEGIANNLWTDLPSIKHMYSIFSSIFLHAPASDQNRERCLLLNVINRHLPFLQSHYIKAIRDGFKFVTFGAGDVVCSGLGDDSDPCCAICQHGELSICYDDRGNGSVCIDTVCAGQTIGLDILQFIATNWFDETALSAAPLKQAKCIATRESKLWVITRGDLLSAVLKRSNHHEESSVASSVEVDMRCLASFGMSLCLDLEQKCFCLEAVRQMRLHLCLSPKIYLHPSRPLKKALVKESLSLVLGKTSASVVESLLQASGGRLLINNTRIMGHPIKRAALAVFVIHTLIAAGLTVLNALNRVGRVEDVTVGVSSDASFEFLIFLYIAWFLFSGLGIYAVLKASPRFIQAALIGQCIAVCSTIIGLIASSYSELGILPYATVYPSSLLLY